MRKNQSNKKQAILMSGIVAVLVSSILLLIYRFVSNRGD